MKTKKSPYPEGVDKILLGDGHSFVESTARGGRCLTYCEVTGAPKLIFPLGLTAVYSSSREVTAATGNRSADYGGSGPRTSAPAGVGEDEHSGSLAGAQAWDGAVSTPIDDAVVVEKAALQALRALNSFVGGLATADASVEAAADKKSGRCGGGGIAPYTI